MKDKLRELVKEWLCKGEYAKTSGAPRCGGQMIEDANELLAILDTEGDDGAVPVAVQTRYQGPNKTVNTDWRPCSFAHAQAVKDARCDVTEIRYLYTHPARSGVVSDEDVATACRKYYNCGHPVYPPVFEGMRAALESYERSRK